MPGRPSLLAERLQKDKELPSRPSLLEEVCKGQKHILDFVQDSLLADQANKHLAAFSKAELEFSENLCQMADLKSQSLLVEADLSSKPAPASHQVLEFYLR